MYQTIEHSGMKLRRWIPDKAIEVKEESGLGIVYVYHVDAPVKPLCAVAYRGNAGKSSWHYRFKDMADVDKEICAFFDGLRAHKNMVANRRAEDFKGHTFKVGDIITNSWGYDQTNVDWYRIVRTSANYVWLQPIAAEIQEADGCSPMAGYSTVCIDTSGPDPRTWGVKDLNEPMERHRASGSYVSMKFGCGSKWEGEKKYTSWYA